MQQLTELFANASQHCEQFAQLLEKEKLALLGQEMAVLEALVHSKTPLIAQLQADEQVISSRCQALGREQDASLTDFINSLGNPELSAQHARFLAAAQQCQQANLHNARLVRHSQHLNSTLLDLLRNQGEASQNMYDRQGKASRGPSQRPISRA